MKKLLLALCLAVLLAACSTQPAPVGDVPAASQSSAGTGASALALPPGMTQQQKDVYTVLLGELLEKQCLQNDWEGTPVPQEPVYPYISEVEVLDAQRQEDIITVTAQSYSYIYLDLVTMTETASSAWMEPIQPHDGAALPVGDITVEFKDTNGLLTPISCHYHAYENPGIRYLKARTQELQPQLADSPRLDVENYDPMLVNCLWRSLALRRYLASPAEITQWDLEQIETVNLSAYTLLPGESRLPPDLALDAQLLTRLPNLRNLGVNVQLEDYGVLAQLPQLETVSLEGLDTGPTDLSALACKARRLELHDPVGALDLSGVEVEELYIGSWRTALDSITGGGKVEKLYWESTRSNMRILNKEAFPNVRYLNLNFFSEMERVRDFSQLATFDPQVKIDLCLTYKACNNETLKSLAGVRLDTLGLDPGDGPDSSHTFDEALLEAIPAATVLRDSQTMEMHTSTGD